MNLLAGKLYDPAGAVVVATSTGTGIALRVFDTTNLRHVFAVPPSGFVRVRMSAQIHGATTFPTVLLGVMSGAGIVARQQPMQSLGNTAVATAQVKIESDFIVAGLTAGETRTCDAAWGLEVSVASSAIKYGGPNDTIANNAFGGFAFEIWDPCPFYTPTSGVPPTSPVIAYTSGIRAKTDTLPAAPASTTNITAGVITTVTNLTNAPTAGDLTATMKTSVTTAATAATPTAAAVTGAVGSVTGAVGSVTGNVGGNVTGSVGSVVGAVGSVTGLTASNLDTTVSSRMATYTQPTGFLTAVFPADPASETTVNTRLATAGYTAPDNTGIATILTEVSGLSVTDITAIKAKTDSLTFTIAGQVDSNPKSVNDLALTGVGTAGNPWGPA